MFAVGGERPVIWLKRIGGQAVLPYLETPGATMIKMNLHDGEFCL